MPLASRLHLAAPELRSVDLVEVNLECVADPLAFPLAGVWVCPIKVVVIDKAVLDSHKMIPNSNKVCACFGRVVSHKPGNRTSAIYLRR
tara:strand:+ start:567 stop:833 length:267 start_codon:yes stop_codon:yes gene_type:complete